MYLRKYPSTDRELELEFGDVTNRQLSQIKPEDRNERNILARERDRRDRELAELREQESERFRRR